MKSIQNIIFIFIFLVSTSLHADKQHNQQILPEGCMRQTHFASHSSFDFYLWNMLKIGVGGFLATYGALGTISGIHFMIKPDKEISRPGAALVLVTSGALFTVGSSLFIHGIKNIHEKNMEKAYK